MKVTSVEHLTLTTSKIKDIYSDISYRLELCKDVDDVKLVEVQFAKELQLLKDDGKKTNRIAHTYPILESKIEEKKELLKIDIKV